MNLNKSFSRDDTKAKEWMTKHPILTVIIFVFFVIVFMNMLGGSSNENTSTPETIAQKAEKDREINSIVFAESVIKKILKAPSTAKFVDVEAYELSNEKDVWAVNGSVDSQNSFGAMIRNQWEVQLDYRDGKGGTIKSVLFDGKKIQ